MLLQTHRPELTAADYSSNLWYILAPRRCCFTKPGLRYLRGGRPGFCLCVVAAIMIEMGTEYNTLSSTPLPPSIIITNESCCGGLATHCAGWIRVKQRPTAKALVEKTHRQRQQTTPTHIYNYYYCRHTPYDLLPRLQTPEPICTAVCCLPFGVKLECCEAQEE